MRHFSALLLAVCIFLFQTISPSSAEAQVKSNNHINTYELFKQSSDYIKQELIVKFKSGTSVDEKSKLLQKHALVQLESNPTGNFTLVKSSSPHLENMAKEIMASKQVEYVEPNYRMDARFTPVDPNYKKQWYTGKLNLPGAWQQTKGSSSIKVALIDSGVQVNHPDLIGKIVNPYNAITGRSTFPADDHGTHVAGIIAATMNKTGIAGIAPNIKIMPINVFEGEDADIYTVADAIIYAADKGANIMNLSLGTDSESSALEYAVDYAESKGVLLVAAAGNERTFQPSYPAALSQTIGVSATDENDRITYYSNYGKYIDFAAPGNNIYSTITKSTYQYMSGTSMAAPMVTGVSALILSKNPFLSSSQVIDILKKSSLDLGNIGKDTLYGYGRIDAAKSLSNTPLPLSPIEVESTTFTMNGTTKLPISFHATSGGSVSLEVLNSKNAVVKRLIPKKSWTGGNITSEWDGKLDNGTYASSGTYKLVARISNSKTALTQSKPIQVADRRTPAIKKILKNRKK
ncbi:S8 family serine peptidase [Bacillus sp. CECT 9360]|uniref:S8 family serine peptidase n=1 Tax=Bacillus sp. CECT 9360 TaxID=2845821 RepID=UPI001E58CA01|nr:S8 family serine peptidase [Bacillus sp. CECT 9360]CAH0345139.1 hypothetical protein BCI9360_01418 [Bacillus sp. CECT 9360]